MNQNDGFSNREREILYRLDEVTRHWREEHDRERERWSKDFEELEESLKSQIATLQASVMKLERLLDRYRGGAFVVMSLGGLIGWLLSIWEKLPFVGTGK